MKCQKSILSHVLFFSTFFVTQLCADQNFTFVSQSGQDKFLYKQFFKQKKNGVFVDIGAHDGVTYSNTYFLEKKMGWTGVCVEPIPAVFAQLEKNRDCICVKGCIAGLRGKKDFMVISGYAEMLSGLVESYDPRHLNRIDKDIGRFGGKRKTIEVECYRLSDILSEHGIWHVDFLGIDTEGSELEILRSIDFDAIDIDIVCVENNYNDPSMKELLTDAGYQFVTKLGGDEIYKKNRSGTVSKQFIAQFLPKDPVVIEAGAHNGTDTHELSKTWPVGTIHAFEPIGRLFKNLTRVEHFCTNVKSYQMALGPETGTAIFHVSGGTSDGSSSLLAPKEVADYHPTVSFKSSIDVDVMTLDDWAQKNNVKRVDFMWLDMQGSELDMLKASPSMLETTHAIYTEVSLVELYNGCSLYDEVRTWLESKGFVVVREEIPWQDGGNVLFVRKEFLK